MSESVYVLRTSIPYGDAWPLRAYHTKQAADAAAFTLSLASGNLNSPYEPEWVDRENWRLGKHFDVIEVTLE